MKPVNEGLKFGRLMMVLSSFLPLFVIWAIRGNTLIPGSWFVLGCLVMGLIPSLYLWLRIVTAKKQKQMRPIVIGKAEDHRDHLLVYLFTMLLPFYSADLSTFRDLISALAALSFIVLIFWHMNLHYMNIIFAILGYRVFTIYPIHDDNPLSGKSIIVLITQRISISDGDKINAYRLSNTVYIE